MMIQNLYKPVEVEYMEVDVCPVKEHRHTFFEFIYIIQGNGEQHVNQQVTPYEAGNLFLMLPMDKHFFTLRTTTAFLFVRFNDIYLEAQRAKSDHNGLGDWIQKMEYIYHNSTHSPGCILREEADKPLVRALIEALIRENNDERSFQREVLQQLVNTLITIVARNISVPIPDGSADGSRPALELVNYIHAHIYSPELLKASVLAAHFHISLNYISEFFKKKTGEGLQQYITHYKLKLVETRLRYSDLRIGEIVSELGFTDESHLNRSFKKYKGVSPSAFRKQSKQASLVTRMAG
jgi:AraC-like DNA-binding protein